MRILALALLLSAAHAWGQAEPLFNGRDLGGWKVVPFDGGGRVSVLSNGWVMCDAGDPLSGIVYTNRPPTMCYELSVEAMRVKGADFFVALTLPVVSNYCTVVIGGWGGCLCGISSVDYMDASENQWGEARNLENDRWYQLRVRVTPGVLQVWLDNDVYTARVEYGDPKRLSLRAGDIDKTVPLGLATYRTRALWRNFTVTPIEALEVGDKPRGE